MRIAIAGVPRAGKTTYALALAQETGHPVVHADDFIPMGWSAASAEVARRLISQGPYVIEGVSVVRGLRKALELTAEKPCDRLHWLGAERQPLSSGQLAMGNADRGRLNEIRGELIRRGVQIVEDAPNLPSVPTPPSRTTAPPVPKAPSPTGAIPVAAGSRWFNTPGRGFG